jgi:molybdopterin adenylyltransferase
MQLSSPPTLRVGIVTVSDRAAAGAYDDLSGAAIRDCLQRWIQSPWEEVYRCIPDERLAVEATLIELCDVHDCALIITTGGTGPALRDVTPEATTAVCSRLLPGFAEAMRTESLRTVPTAILSRQVAGMRGTSLIVNLPGKPAAIEVCLKAIWDGVAPCIRLLRGATFTNSNAAPLRANVAPSEATLP